MHCLYIKKKLKINLIDCPLTICKSKIYIMATNNNIPTGEQIKAAYDTYHNATNDNDYNLSKNKLREMCINWLNYHWLNRSINHPNELYLSSIPGFEIVKEILQLAPCEGMYPNNETKGSWADAIAELKMNS